MERSFHADALAAPAARTLAYLDGLPLPALYSEMLLAAARAIARSVTYNDIAQQARCRDCYRWHESPFDLEHTEDCPTGYLSRLLAAIGTALAKQAPPTTPPERSTPPPSASEPADAAGAGQPQLLPDGFAGSAYGEPWQVDGDGDLVDAQGYIIADIMGCALPDAEARQVFARAAACVNACAGMTIPGLRARWVTAPDAAAVLQQVGGAQ